MIASSYRCGEESRVLLVASIPPPVVACLALDHCTDPDCCACDGTATRESTVDVAIDEARLSRYRYQCSGGHGTEIGCLRDMAPAWIACACGERSRLEECAVMAWPTAEERRAWEGDGRAPSDDAEGP